jgi:catechol 2,3-dioxygenase-like lactoylglutathione lyase family enzyme
MACSPYLLWLKTLRYSSVAFGAGGTPPARSIRKVDSMKLASVRLVTEDLPALAAFYSVLTGTEPVTPFGPGDYAELHTEGSIIALVTTAGVERFNNAAAVAAANRSAILEFEVDDVDDERARLGDRVTDWVQEPTTQPWGNRSMLFRDPDGNLINVYATAG